MTDRELTVLKAIDRVGRGGLALIPDVVRAISYYTKATIKKTLIELSEKGIVSLHRHDWPSSLTPAERKVMVLHKGNYYNAVTVRKKNPLSSDGLPVVDRQGESWKRSKRLVRANIAKREKYQQSIVDYARKLHASGKYTDEQVWKATWNRFGYQGSVSNGVLTLHIDGKAYKVNLSMPNPRRKNKTIIKAKRVVVARKAVVLNPKRKTAKKATTKRRRKNLDHPDSRHQVQVSKHWRAGGASQWQRAHKAGQTDLFAHGIKARNSARIDSAGWAREMGRLRDIKPRPLAKLYGTRGPTPEQKAKWDVAMREWSKQFRHASKMQKITLKEDNEAFHARKQNASKSGRSRKMAPARRAVSVRRKTRKRAAKKNPTTLKKLVSKAVKAVKRAVKGKRNPSAPEIRKTFAGRHTRDDRLIFPDGTPTGLAKLGRLVSISTDSGKFAPVKGTAWLCSDTRGKLHIGTPTKGHVIASGPATNYGYVREIEYEESKPHLGYSKKTLFFHKLGEETGVKPRLVTDGKGGAKFVGGAYKIKREGIIN